ncbi:hypothetical protein GN956_G9309 [Arapaima gigas]
MTGSVCSCHHKVATRREARAERGADPAGDKRETAGLSATGVSTCLPAIRYPQCDLSCGSSLMFVSLQCG